MHHLLLVSILTIIQRMTILNSKKELISLNVQNNPKIDFPSKKDVILCKHCKRTASNGIRCLGMCVADNDY